MGVALRTVNEVELHPTDEIFTLAHLLDAYEKFSSPPRPPRSPVSPSRPLNSVPTRAFPRGILGCAVETYPDLVRIFVTKLHRNDVVMGIAGHRFTTTAEALEAACQAKCWLSLGKARATSPPCFRAQETIRRSFAFSATVTAIASLSAERSRVTSEPAVTILRWTSGLTLPPSTRTKDLEANLPEAGADAEPPGRVTILTAGAPPTRTTRSLGSMKSARLSRRESASQRPRTTLPRETT